MRLLVYWVSVVNFSEAVKLSNLENPLLSARFVAITPV